jgi:hypothetical protein
MPKDRKEYMREYRKKNKEKIKEQNREYMIEYREKNRERIKEQKKEYREANKDKIKAYYHANKEKINEYKKTPNGKKTNTISHWIGRGLICDDIDGLYDSYLDAKNCDLCKVEFGSKGIGSRRCMDHDHETGLFRNFLCSTCNLQRK